MLDWNKNYLNMSVGSVGVADLTNLIYRENLSGSLAMKNLSFKQKRKKNITDCTPQPRYLQARSLKVFSSAQRNDVSQPGLLLQP